MHRRSILSVGALALAAVLSATGMAQAKEWKTVTIATEGAYEPWNLTRPDGTLDGFEVELVKDLCARIKIECKLIPQDWDGMITSLNAGKFDMIMDALSITPERKEVIAFTAPYAATSAGFATLKSGDLANLAGTGTQVKLTGEAAHDKATVDALRAAIKGKTIGLQAATIYTKFIYENFKDIADIREYKTSAERDLDLMAGRIDLAFDDTTYLAGAIAKPDNADMALAGPAIGGIIWGEGEGFGIRKSDPELKALFDPAIAAALADGTVKRLSLKWLKVDVSP
jgi:octopine/nopaline transport system substrate-binding protein